MVLGYARLSVYFEMRGKVWLLWRGLNLRDRGERSGGHMTSACFDCLPKKIRSRFASRRFLQIDI